MFRGLRNFFLVGAPMTMLMAGAACTGQIGDATERGPTGPGGKGPGARPTEPGKMPDPSNPDEPPMSVEPPTTIAGDRKCVSGKPGPRLLRRLSVEQLDNTVRDLFRNASAPHSNVFND